MLGAHALWSAPIAHSHSRPPAPTKPSSITARLGVRRPRLESRELLPLPLELGYVVALALGLSFFTWEMGTRVPSLQGCCPGLNQCPSQSSQGSPDKRFLNQGRMGSHPRLGRHSTICPHLPCGWNGSMVMKSIYSTCIYFFGVKLMDKLVMP